MTTLTSWGTTGCEAPLATPRISAPTLRAAQRRPKGKCWRSDLCGGRSGGHIPPLRSRLPEARRDPWSHVDEAASGSSTPEISSGRLWSSGAQVTRTEERLERRAGARLAPCQLAVLVAEFHDPALTAGRDPGAKGRGPGLAVIADSVCHVWFSRFACLLPDGSFLRSLTWVRPPWPWVSERARLWRAGRARPASRVPGEPPRSPPEAAG